MTRSSVRKSLKVVNLAGNDIEKIDAKFWLNTNLEEVNLSENKEIILNHLEQQSIVWTPYGILYERSKSEGSQIDAD